MDFRGVAPERVCSVSQSVSRYFSDSCNVSGTGMPIPRHPRPPQASSSRWLGYPVLQYLVNIHINKQELERSPASSQFDHCSTFLGDRRVLQSGHQRGLEFFRACSGEASTACGYNWIPASGSPEALPDTL